MIRISIVEDHEMVREGLKALITKNSDMAIVAEHSSASEWLANFKKGECDVLLIDINLPHIDGLKALTQALEVDSELKAIVLTMHNDLIYIKEALITGAKGFILKCQSVQELEKGIRDVHKGYTFFSDEFLRRVAKSLKEDQEQVASASSMPVQLSDKELQLLASICKGYTNKQLADQMYLSIKSIESYKSKLMRKTNTNNNASLIVWAIKNQVVNI